MQKIPFYLLVSLLIIVLHTTIGKYVAIGNVVPDLLVVWIVYIAVAEGQIPATLIGFLVGLVVDLISGSDGMLGLSSLTKCSVGFLAGYVHDENRTSYTLGSAKFVVLTGVLAGLHNILYLTVFLQGSDVRWWGAMLTFGLPGAVYTAALALFPMFYFSRKLL